MVFLLRTLGIFFIAVMAPRVAIYANRFAIPGPDGLAWNPWHLLGAFFAVGLGLGVYVMTYFSHTDPDPEDEEPYDSLTSQQKRARDRRERARALHRAAARKALTAAYFFAVLDGLFNLAEVSTVAIQSGTIRNLFSPVNGDIVALLSIWAFGLVPTFASVLAGWVTSAIDQVPGLGKALPTLKGRPSPKMDNPVPVTSYRGWRAAGDPLVPAERKAADEKFEDFRSSVAGKKRDELNVNDLANWFGVSRRTIFRWLSRLEEELSDGPERGHPEGTIAVGEPEAVAGIERPAAG